MAHLNKAAYHYLLNHSDEITDRWIELFREEKQTLYADDAEETTKQMLRKQHRLTIITIACSLLEDEELYERNLENWVQTVARSRVETETPIYQVLEAVSNTATVIWEKVEEFIQDNDEAFSNKRILRWSKNIHKSFDEMNNKFTRLYQQLIETKMGQHQEELYKVSSPVIPLLQGIGIFPLIGEIGDRRMHFLLEYVPEQCKALQIRTLFIDLSGTSFTSDCVIHQVKQLIEILAMLGISCSVSGIRPEMVKSIGLEQFIWDVSCYSSLEQALNRSGFYQEKLQKMKV